jgi:hypothetical protein
VTQEARPKRMITYLIIIVAVLVLLYLLMWFLRRPPRYRRIVSDDLSKFFNALLNDDYPAGFLVIEAPDKNRFVQFARYTKDREPGIQFDFPRAPWSEPYYGKLNRILSDKGIDFETQAIGENTVVSFITVDLQKDLTKAMELARLVLVDVFGLGPDDRIKVYLSK